MRKTFNTYNTEAEAIADMKAMRKRKYTITYSEVGKCFVAWFNK